MKSSPKLSILGGLLLLLVTGAAEATPVTSADAANFNPNVYISQWNAGLNPAADAVANISLNLNLLSSSGNDSLALVAPAGDAQLQSTGTLAVTIVSLLDKVDLDKRHHKPKPPTVPEPGVLSLIGLGLLALALVTRGTRRLRAAVVTTGEAFSAATTHPQG
jgi:hypothetical protein